MEGRSGNAANTNTITFIVSLITLCLLIVYVISAVAVKHKRKSVMKADGAVGGHGERREEDGGAATKSGRFSLTKARAKVEVVDKVPDDFKKYKFDMTQPTGVHADWRTSSTVLSDMCKMLTEGLAYAIRKGGLFETAAAQQVEPVAFNNARLVIAVTENFIMRFKAAVANAQETLPWSEEWDPSVCDSVIMMAHYLLLEQNATMWEEVVELILKIVKSPTTALSYTATTEPVTILKLAGAWILARYMQGSGESSATEADYVTAMRQAKVVVRHAKTDTGTHMDHGYYASKSVDFGYLKRLCDPKITFFYGLDTKLVQTRLFEWTTVKNIILHPTVKCGNVGLLGNNRDFKCHANRTSVFGVRVMPFCGYMRYFTKDRQFSVRAQKSHLAYYVVDKRADDMAQYWVQYRNVHGEKSPTAAKFPDVGFVHKASQTKLVAMPAPSGGATTNELMPVAASTKSFVMAYKRFGVMYQEYEIAEFGQFAVTELVVVDTAAQTVDIKLKIVNREETEELHYYGAEVKRFVVPAKGTKTYVTKMDMATGKSETTELATKDFPGFPLKLDTGIVIRDQTTLKSYLLFDNGVPVLWAPNNWAYELPNLVYNVDTTTEIFTFDATANQYMNVKTSLR